LPQRGLLVTLLAVLTAIPLAAFCQSPTLPEEYRFATGLYKQQRWDLAADAFRKFLQKHPDHERVPYARLYLGLTLVNADKLSDARQVLREYVRDYPRSKSLADALYRVGECSYLLDDLKAAETEFQQFLKQYPEHDLVEWALPYLADTKLRLKKPEAARDLFKKALAQYPHSRLTEDSNFGLARAYEDLQETDAASAIYAQLAENKPTGSRAAQSLMNLATIRFRAGKYEDASKSFLRLTADFPKSRLLAAAHLNAGFSLYQMGQYRRAIEEFDRAAADKRQATTASYWKGITFKALGDTAQATQIIKSTYQADPQGPMAESALFYWADCELRSAHYAPAKGLFLELVRKWPQGEFADDSLHFAGEAALLAGSIDEAETLVQRFEKEHRNSPLALHEEILLGRVLNAKAAALLKQSTGSKQGGGPDGNQNRRQADELRRTAIEHVEKVVAESRLPRTVALARFHLGRILQDAGQHARAVEALAPLVKQAEQPQASAEAVESLVISAHSQSELGNQEAAIAAFSKYLALRPKGGQAEQALADRALANARLGKTQAAGADALLLLKEFPQSSVGADTLRRLAERAYDAKEWTGAAELFQMMVERGAAESDLRRIGLSGLGWAKFQLKAYDESAAAFEQVFDRFSVRHPQVAEAGYMRGRALQEAGKRSEAAKAYADAFQKLSPSTPGEPGAETAGPAQYGFLAGVQAANLLAQLKRYDESDTAYRLVVERFPKAPQVGQVLFDWANMLYVARKEPEQRGRVREILTRIVRDFPESSAQNSARLFLAELDLLDGKVSVAEKAFRDVLADPKADAKVREDGLSRLIAVAADKEDWTSVQNLAGKFLAQFPTSPDIRLVRLNLAASQLGLKDPAAAEQTLVKLQREFSDAGGETPDWSARVWVLLAEAFYQEKKYDDVQTTVEDLRHRMPKSALLYQADEILGRSFKKQAQWDKAIAAFQRVIDDRQGELNETAAKSRLMIAECWFLQKNYRQAREDYLKVYTLYDKLPEWAAPALFQVGQCEENLKQPRDAEKTYHDLIASFPQSNYAEKAKQRLDELHKRPAG